MRKRLLAIIATAAMVVTMIPSMAFADASVDTETELKEAIANGETNITITAPINFSDDTVLEANTAVTITTDQVDVFTVGSGKTLTLGKNITVNSTNSILWANGGVINVDGATLNSSSNTNNLGFANNAGVINVKSGAVNGTGDKTTLSVSGTNSKVNVSGGKVTASKCTAITAKNGAVATISGGTVETTCLDPAFVATWSNTNGKIVVSGGTVKAAAGLAVDAGYNGGDAEITGGDIVGGVEADQGSEMIITGGTFSDDSAKAYVADGYELVNGKVVAEGSAAPTTPAKPDKSPNTGDNSMAPIAVAGLVMAAMAAVVATRRRYN